MLTAVALTAVLTAAPGAPAATTPAVGAAPDFAPGEVVAQFDGQRFGRSVQLPPDIGVRAAVKALRSNPRVHYAVPNYIATASSLPNDPGTVPPVVGQRSGWAALQWNFLPCGSFCAPGTPALPAQSPGGIDAVVFCWRCDRMRGRAVRVLQMTPNGLRA